MRSESKVQWDPEVRVPWGGSNPLAAKGWVPSWDGMRDRRKKKEEKTHETIVGEKDTKTGVTPMVCVNRRQISVDAEMSEESHFVSGER